jgi:tetratricopeptide (TPR) repeat protein
MQFDVRQPPISINDSECSAIYEEALRQYQSFTGDPIGTIDRALSKRPDFVLGHAVRAGLLMTVGEKRFADQARSSVEAAEALVARANDRERGLIVAARRLVDGAWDEACRAYDRVLVDYPLDAFALQTGHLFDFYRGDAANLRNRVARVLPHWSPAVPGYSYVLGMYAFGLEECNQYADAERTALRALAIEPRDGWAVHAAVHVMEMSGRIDEGIEFLEAGAKDWAPDNGFAYHNYWHLALFYLDRGRIDRVFELYDQKIYPSPSDMSLQLIDATGLLFRLQLLGVETGDRFARIAEVWEGKLETERGFYAFNDAHAMMAFAATDRKAAALQLMSDMEATSAGHGLAAAMTREVGLPVARGVLELSRGHYEHAIEAIEPVRDIAHRFGGSHAQRDLLTLSIIEAALRSGQTRLARHYLAERKMFRPGSALGWRLDQRALDVEGERNVDQAAQ